MELTIVASTYNKIVSVDSITVVTSAGSFVIQHGHAPILLMLAPEKHIVWQLACASASCTDTTEKLLLARGGVLNVMRTCATLITYE